MLSNVHEIFVQNGIRDAFFYNPKVKIKLFLQEDFFYKHGRFIKNSMSDPTITEISVNKTWSSVSNSI